MLMWINDYVNLISTVNFFRPPANLTKKCMNFAGYYRPYYRPTTTEKPKVEALECGSGSIYGGATLTCLLRTECIAQGGRLGVPCGRGFSKGFCCECKSPEIMSLWHCLKPIFLQTVDNVLKCGDTTSAVHAIFRNPDFPDTTDKPISCIVGIEPRPEACGIR